MCHSIINYILSCSVDSSLDPVADHADQMLIKTAQSRLNEHSAER